MATMNKLNTKLKELLEAAEKETVDLPMYDTENLLGHAAYSVPEEQQLLAILNTSKLEPQYYRSQVGTVLKLKTLIDHIASTDPYFVAQCIVWSRCCGEGLRAVNQLAAAMLAPYLSGTDWGKRFYGAFDKKAETPTGGVIYRLDDMSGIKDFYFMLTGQPLSNAMRKGFSRVLLTADSYELLKYKKAVIDIANLTHPNVQKAKATVDGTEVKTIDAIIRGLSVSADTWEAANSEAGRLVAKAVREGTISTDEATEILKEAKNDNWEELLKAGKLGIFAAVRNIRNILSGGRAEVIDMLCTLISDGQKIREGKIMPYQMELAMSIVHGIPHAESKKILAALEEGLLAALPNFKELLPGKNLIMIDCSSSMRSRVTGKYASCNSSCLNKAAVLVAMMAKSIDVDVIRFGSKAEYVSYSPFDSILTIAKTVTNKDMGGTNISSAFDLIVNENRDYDRIFLLSDNEANQGCLRSSYRNYLKQGHNPYVYCVDLAGYGTVPMASPTGRVNFYNGYGYSMLDDIARLEFKPDVHINKVREVVI